MNKPALGNIQFEEPKPAYRQITDHIRNMVMSGELKPGAKLPSTQELSLLWNKQAPTIQAALTPLVREGLLVRYPYKGTFVSERQRQLKTIGLYYFGNKLSNPESRYIQTLHQCILNRIAAKNLRWAMWNDPRPPEEAVEPWDLLEDACRQGEIDALIAPLLDLPHEEWLRKLPIPQAFQGSTLPNTILGDSRQLTAKAVEELARQGCRSIGLISAWPSPTTEKPFDAILHASYQGFISEARARGLQTREEWIASKDETYPASAARFGYEAFTRIWAHPEHPEGLVVINDAESEGVTTAILERGLRIPEQLRLAYHKTQEVDLLCPFPVTYIGNSATESAEALLQLLEWQFEGKPVKPIVIGYRCLTHTDPNA